MENWDYGRDAKLSKHNGNGNYSPYEYVKDNV